MKRACVCLFLVCMTMSYSHAVGSNDFDCNSFSSSSEEGYVTSINEAFNAATPEREKYDLLFFTDDDLQVVVRHLQQYCCEDLVSKDGCTESPGPHYYASSPMIGDHLISLGFRKMDGVTQHCKIITGKDCAHRQELPDLAEERRETITDIAEDREGYPPVQLEELFKKYRGSNKANDDALAAIGKRDRPAVNTLRAQYELLCEEIERIQQRGDPITGEGINYTEVTGGAGLGNFCKQMARERYEQEYQYVRTLMVEKGIEYLTQNLRAYSLDYFIDNRFSDLSDKYTALEGCFSTVLSYSTNTSCCNE